MTYHVKIEQVSSIYIVGCGGTGSLVSEGLCRLLINMPDIKINLVDYDRVEPQNLIRQNFVAGDIGKFKSQALAERLSRTYGRQVRYSIYPFEPDTLRSCRGDGVYSYEIHAVVIGCVDGPEARRQIAECMDSPFWWIDSGNGKDSGQILIGNVTDPTLLKGSFDEENYSIKFLPAPTLQIPALLAPISKLAAKDRDCAEAVIDNEQNPIINQAMAVQILDMVYKLINGELSYMGAYIDLATGNLRTVRATPELIARMFRMKVSDLMVDHYCSRGLLMRPEEVRGTPLEDFIITEQGGE